MPRISIVPKPTRDASNIIRLSKLLCKDEYETRRTENPHLFRIVVKNTNLQLIKDFLRACLSNPTDWETEFCNDADVRRVWTRLKMYGYEMATAEPVQAILL